MSWLYLDGLRHVLNNPFAKNFYVHYEEEGKRKRVNKCVLWQKYSSNCCQATCSPGQLQKRRSTYYTFMLQKVSGTTKLQAVRTYVRTRACINDVLLCRGLKNCIAGTWYTEWRPGLFHLCWMCFADQWASRCINKGRKTFCNFILCTPQEWIPSGEVLNWSCFKSCMY